MTHLRGDDFGRAASALARVPFNCLFARSVVDRTVDGAVWVDDERDPALVHVINPYGMSLLVVAGDGEGDRDALRDHLRDWRRERGGLWLQLHPQTFAPTLERLLDAGNAASPDTPGDATAQRYTRVNFRFDQAEYAARRRSLPVGTGAGVRPMTAAEFALPGITVSPHMFWRTPEQFLAHGGGRCVTDGGAVTSIAFTSFRRDAQLELGVATVPEHRGKGHARIACDALIEHCLAEGLEPVWSCRKENQASYALAQSLGFVPAFEGAYYHLPALQR